MLRPSGPEVLTPRPSRFPSRTSFNSSGRTNILTQRHVPICIGVRKAGWTTSCWVHTFRTSGGGRREGGREGEVIDHKDHMTSWSVINSLG